MAEVAAGTKCCTHDVTDNIDSKWLDVKCNLHIMALMGAYVQTYMPGPMTARPMTAYRWSKP